MIDASDFNHGIIIIVDILKDMQNIIILIIKVKFEFQYVP